MSDILSAIIAHKKNEVAAKRLATPLSSLEKRLSQQTAPRGFARALDRARREGRYGLICEIKKASPSAGLIRSDFDPPALARDYETGGATCLSVLTDEKYFQGSDDDLVAARSACVLPVLRKDFIVDAYQVSESRTLGADCILLILATLEDDQAHELEAAAFALGMDVLIEVHNAAELSRALKMKSPLIGINNRNLKSMTVDLATSRELAKKIPEDRVIIAESGLHTPQDLAALHEVGISCFLIGESLMLQADVASATKELAQPGAMRGS